MISGILHILKTGGRWRDVPPEYGPAKTIYNRYTRWARRGVWQRIFAKVAAAGPIPEELALDSSNVKAHRSASGGKGGSSVKRLASRAAADQRKSIVGPMIVAVAVTPDNVADITMAVPILEALAPTRRLIADKAYDADRLRTWLEGKGIEAVIPGRAARAVEGSRSR
ncbi:IS5 family transposase [Microvirga soli]|uniref:IS5 family transposase n=1 Tax=Microvirga soli TaxID=1854496 RepID=UPI0028A81D49|nr:IS5 family transposase [Microvirga soli]